MNCNGVRPEYKWATAKPWRKMGASWVRDLRFVNMARCEQCRWSHRSGVLNHTIVWEGLVIALTVATHMMGVALKPPVFDLARHSAIMLVHNSGSGSDWQELAMARHRMLLRMEHAVDFWWRLLRVHAIPLPHECSYASVHVPRLRRTEPQFLVQSGSLCWDQPACRCAAQYNSAHHLRNSLEWCYRKRDEHLGWNHISSRTHLANGTLSYCVGFNPCHAE